MFTEKNPEAEPVASTGRTARYEPDPALRDFEMVPLKDNIDAYFEREVRAYVLRRLDGQSKGQGGVRDQFQPAFLQVHATATLGSDRRGIKGSRTEDHAVAAGGDGVRTTPLRQWPTMRLRYLTLSASSEERRMRLADLSEASFLPMEAIGDKGQVDLSATRPIAEVASGYSQFFDGDVVVAKITPCFENGKGALIQGAKGRVGFGTTELHVLRPGPDLDGRFLYYVTMDPNFRQRGEASMTGAAGSSVSQ